MRAEKQNEGQHEAPPKREEKIWRKIEKTISIQELIV